jgi:hypothetical protein
MNINISNPAAARSARDPRLDFFRGMAMFIILIAHIPGNVWSHWIPARFGFSDAAEIFVFCSGMASAVAFGLTFQNRGWLLGSMRVSYRVWQVYWSHICVFFVIAAMLVFIDGLGWHEQPNRFRDALNLAPFFDRPAENLVGLLSLTYVPNYFDILPMYLVILCLIPIIMFLAARSLYLAGAFVLGLWLAANLDMIALPAEPWSNREWFFNPFGWQLVFFTGFAFMRGWIKPPPVNRVLIGVALAYVLLTMPLAYYHMLVNFEVFREIRGTIVPLIGKTDVGALRFVHFLAVAYLSWVAVGEGGRRLVSAGLWGQVVAIIQKVGQQSLAVFLVSLVAARFGGVVLDVVGRSTLNVALVNIAGIGLLIATAYAVAYYKAQPWRTAPAADVRPPRPTQQGSTSSARAKLEI